MPQLTDLQSRNLTREQPILRSRVPLARDTEHPIRGGKRSSRRKSRRSRRK